MLRSHRLAPHTSLGIGGPADWFTEVRDEAALLEALGFARREGLPVTLLGGGSNVLVADRGVRGLVIRIRGGRASRLGPDRIRSAAGMTLNGLIRWTIQRGLGGLETWAGTPGVVGGALSGNAHFGGREIRELVVSIRSANADGTIRSLPADAPPGPVVISADFRVTPGDPRILRARARESLAFRKRTQPLGVPSAGCAFRNPPGQEGAGALLDRAGLKGRAVGRVRVSEIHANFLVAEAGASAGEYRTLLEECREAVARRFGIRLEPEIVQVGDFGA